MSMMFTDFEEYRQTIHKYQVLEGILATKVILESFYKHDEGIGFIEIKMGVERI